LIRQSGREAANACPQRIVTGHAHPPVVGECDQQQVDLVNAHDRPAERRRNRGLGQSRRVFRVERVWRKFVTNVQLLESLVVAPEEFQRVDRRRSSRGLAPPANFDARETAGDLAIAPDAVRQALAKPNRIRTVRRRRSGLRKTVDLFSRSHRAILQRSLSC
jgi:hypothetical protein